MDNNQVIYRANREMFASEDGINFKLLKEEKGLVIDPEMKYATLNYENGDTHIVAIEDVTIKNGFMEREYEFDDKVITEATYITQKLTDFNM